MAKTHGTVEVYSPHGIHLLKIRTACVARFHRCILTLVCHRSSTLKVKMDGQKTCPMSQPLLPTIHEAAGQLWAALRSVYCATQGVLSPTPPAASLL